MPLQGFSMPLFLEILMLGAQLECKVDFIMARAWVL